MVFLFLLHQHFHIPCIDYISIKSLFVTLLTTFSFLLYLNFTSLLINLLVNFLVELLIATDVDAYDSRMIASA